MNLSDADRLARRVEAERVNRERSAPKAPCCSRFPHDPEAGCYHNVVAR